MQFRRYACSQTNTKTNSVDAIAILHSLCRGEKEKGKGGGITEGDMRRGGAKQRMEGKERKEKKKQGDRWKGNETKCDGRKEEMEEVEVNSKH